ncbi:MAG: hypothetical protein IPM29_24785 [Planctomycetes bacterium]|nr:hypothetical protein [Planctomycetota bacterium]
MRRVRRLPYLAFVSTALLSTACGSGGGAPLGAGSVDRSGGTLAIDSGPLAGALLAVPPGALQSPATLSIRAATGPLPELGLRFEAVGPAVAFGPAAVALLRAVEVQVPIALDSPALRRAGGPTLGDVRLLVWPGDRSAFDTFAPTRLDRDRGRARTSVDRLTNVVAVAEILDPAADIDAWLPLLDDTALGFDDGTELRIDVVSDEPNLPREIARLTWQVDDPVRGYTLDGSYWRRDESGATLYEGRFDLDADVQELAVAPLRLAAQRVRCGPGSLRLQRLDYALYLRFGATAPSSWGSTDLTVTVDYVPELETPLRHFRDVLRLTIVADYDQGANRIEQRLWLGRGVGVVAFEFPHRGVAGRLVGGRVGGVPLWGE